MPRALHESARLVRDRVVRRVCERPQRVVADVDASRIDVVLGAGRTVLQVVASVVLRHPRAFDEWTDRRVTVILSEPLPPVFLRVETKEPAWRSLVRELLALIQLDDVEGVDVRRIPVQEPSIQSRIIEERRIPRARLHRIGFCNLVGSRLVLTSHRQPWQQTIVEFHFPRCRLCQHQDRQWRRRTRQQINRIAHRQCGGCDDVGQRPTRRRDVLPRAEVA